MNGRRHTHSHGSSSNRSRSSTPTDIINRKWKLGRKLGSGNFGVVHEAVAVCQEHEDGRTSKVAVKIEQCSVFMPQLYNEYSLYQKFRESNMVSKGMAEILYYGKFHLGNVLHNAMVMTLLSKNLEELFERCDRKFSNKTISMIAVQLITRLEFIHSKGIIYRDVKPENFLVGGTPELADTIFIVDFGLSSEYLDLYGHHIPFHQNRSLTGTCRYMSVNMHLKYEQSRRDDLEALGHMLVYFAKGRLPWQGLRIDNVRERYRKIGEIKQRTGLQELCKGLPELFEYMSYVRNLEFKEKPDYDRVKDLFVQQFVKGGFVADGQFDWSKRSGSLVSSSPNYLAVLPGDRYRQSSMMNRIEVSGTGVSGEAAKPLKQPKRKQNLAKYCSCFNCFRSLES